MSSGHLRVVEFQDCIVNNDILRLYATGVENGEVTQFNPIVTGLLSLFVELVELRICNAFKNFNVVLSHALVWFLLVGDIEARGTERKSSRILPIC